MSSPNSYIQTFSLKKTMNFHENGGSILIPGEFGFIQDGAPPCYVCWFTNPINYNSYISTKMRILIMEARLGHPALVAAVPRYQHLGTDAEQTWCPKIPKSTSRKKHPK